MRMTGIVHKAANGMIFRSVANPEISESGAAIAPNAYASLSNDPCPPKNLAVACTIAAPIANPMTEKAPAIGSPQTSPSRLAVPMN